MQDWQPTDEQVQNWEEKGYFTLPGVVTPDQAAEMRGVIKNIILKISIFAKETCSRKIGGDVR